MPGTLLQIEDWRQWPTIMTHSFRFLPKCKLSVSVLLALLYCIFVSLIVTSLTERNSGTY